MFCTINSKMNKHNIHGASYDTFNSGFPKFIDGKEEKLWPLVGIV